MPNLKVKDTAHLGLGKDADGMRLWSSRHVMRRFADFSAEIILIICFPLAPMRDVKGRIIGSSVQCRQALYHRDHRPRSKQRVSCKNRNARCYSSSLWIDADG